MNVKPYYSEDGQSIAVLVSYGYGAGWSSWEDTRLAYDRRIVKLFLHRAEYKNLDEISEKIASYGYDKPYMGGFDTIRLEWVPINTHWRINEYDGAESIELLEQDTNWIIVGERKDD